MKKTPSKNKLTAKQYLLRGLLALLIFSALLIALLPIIAKQLIISNLEKQGATQVELETLEINLFTGRVMLQGLALQGQSGGLSLDFLQIKLAPAAALFDRHIQVDEIQLDGLSLDVQQQSDQQWQIAGLTLPVASEEKSPAVDPQPESEPWAFSLKKLQFSEINTRLVLPDFKQTIQLQSLEVGALSTQQIDLATPYQLQLVIDQTQLTLSGDALPLQTIPELNLKLELSALALQWLAPYLKQQDVSQLTGAFGLMLDIQAQLTEQPVIHGQLSSSINQLVVDYQHYQVKAEQLIWQSEFHYQQFKNSEGLGLQLDGGLAIEQISVDDTQQKVTLASFKQLQLTELSLQPNLATNFKQLQISHLKLLQQKSAFSEIETLSLNQFNYDGKRQLSLESLIIDSLTQQLQINAEGELSHLAAITTADKEPAEVPAPATESKSEPTEPWHYRLQQLEITNSQISINDASVTPTFIGELKPLQFNLKGIDSQQPQQSAKLSFQTQLNQHQSIELKGDITPLATDPSFTLQGKLQAVDLPPLSPYLEKNLGYFIKRGILNGQFEAKLKQQQLEAKINLNLKKLTIAEGDPAKVQSFTDQLAMPLDSALDLLRDGDDNIQLELLIAGDINEPTFDASQVVNLALGKATQMAAISYVKHLLYPWGTLWSLAVMANDAMVTRFEPVEFTAGNSEVNENYQLYLDKLSTLMIERPSIEMNICGVVSEQDRQALMASTENTTDAEKTTTTVPPIENRHLIQLAEQRGTNVKNYMINAGVAADRLYGCHPEMGDAEQQLPIVELHLE